MALAIALSSARSLGVGGRDPRGGWFATALRDRRLSVIASSAASTSASVAASVSGRKFPMARSRAACASLRGWSIWRSGRGSNPNVRLTFRKLRTLAPPATTPTQKRTGRRLRLTAPLRCAYPRRCGRRLQLQQFFSSFGRDEAAAAEDDVSKLAALHHLVGFGARRIEGRAPFVDAIAATRNVGELALLRAGAFVGHGGHPRLGVTVLICTPFRTVRLLILKVRRRR